MALVKLGGGVTDIRGSMAGNTFSRNAGGNYVRARTKPVNPRSPLQNARRANLAHFAWCWSHKLTPQEREDWIAYANATTWKNRLGETITINGLAAFMRLNTLGAIYGMTIRTAAPTATGHAGGITITFTAESDTGKIAVDEPGGAFDKSILGHNILLFQGHPTRIGRIATPKGFQYLGRIYGHPSAPQDFPVELDTVYTMAEGQYITLRAMWMDEHYRVAGPSWSHDEAAPKV